MKVFKSKSVWTGILGAITAVAGAATGEITYGEGLTTLVASLGTIFMRLALAKGIGIGLDDAIAIGGAVADAVKSAPAAPAGQAPRAGDA